MRTRTLRGRLSPDEQRRLIVDDGDFNHAYKVISFQAFPTAPTGGAQICPVVLTKDEDPGIDFNAGDNRQFGWSISNYDSAGVFSFLSPSVIDPDHVIIQDLYIKNFGTLDSVNYLIVLELMNISTDEAVLQLIKERSQNVN